MTVLAGGRENGFPPDRASRQPRAGRGSGQERTITDSTGQTRPFYLDLHSHSTDASDDAGGTVEGYLKWIVARRKRGYLVDGFVLTEHRQFDPDVSYDDLARQYDTVVLRGAELETAAGHVLVYGITPGFAADFDLSSVSLSFEDVIRGAAEHGGIAVPAHSGRPRIGMAEHVEAGLAVDGITAIEQLNGGSSDAENAVANALAETHGLGRVGGSDAHYVSAIGRCLTAFPAPVRSIEELVEALRAGGYYPTTVDDTAADALSSQRT